MPVFGFLGGSTKKEKKVQKEGRGRKERFLSSLSLPLFFLLSPLTLSRRLDARDFLLEHLEVRVEARGLD
jgi:hypothetical protein